MAWYDPFSWGEKVADDILDKDNGLLTQVGGWIGNLQFTDQEQAEYKMKVAVKAAEFVGKTLDEKTERSVTRRSIAVLWIRVQLSLFLMCAICAPWNMLLAELYFKLATSDVMLWGTGSIIVFFFGGYVWGTHIRKGNSQPKK